MFVQARFCRQVRVTARGPDLCSFAVFARGGDERVHFSRVIANIPRFFLRRNGERVPTRPRFRNATLRSDVRQLF